MKEMKEIEYRMPWSAASGMVYHYAKAISSTMSKMDYIVVLLLLLFGRITNNDM